MKLKLLSEAASLFYATPNLHIRQAYENSHRKHARHVCQWVACDAGYRQSDVARFWKMDGSSIHYGRRVVSAKIECYPEEQEELTDFMSFAKRHIQSRALS
jgi:hypothetical protein